MEHNHIDSIFIAGKIVEWCQENVFRFQEEINAVRYLDYLPTHLTRMEFSKLKLKECQDYIVRTYGAYIKIRTEELVQLIEGISKLAFDFYVQNDEKTAIELCLSVLNNEIDGDIYKGLLDTRIERLILIGTNKKYRDTKYCALKLWRTDGVKAKIHLIREQGKQCCLYHFDDREKEITCD